MEVLLLFQGWWRWLFPPTLAKLFRLFNLTARSTFISSPHGYSRSDSCGPCQTPRRVGAALPPSRSALLAIHHPLPCEDATAPFLFIFFVLSGHLQIWFSPLSPPRLSGPLPCARQNPPNTERRRKSAISSAHPPQAAIVWEEARRRCVSWRGEHDCMCASCLRVPAAESGEQSFQWDPGLDSGAAPPPLTLLCSADLWLLQEA